MAEGYSGLRLGLDVGGTNLRLGVFDGLTLLEETRFQAHYAHICRSHTPEVAWQTILQVTADAIWGLLQRYPAIQAIGIGFPGFINPANGVLAQSPNLPGLQQVNLGTDLSAILGRPVKVENDANAAAYGEYCLLGQPADGLLYLGLGTGVGGGLVVNGKVWSGAHGYAFEAGHLIVEPGGRVCGCGNQGCVEQYASASAISQSYAERSGETRTAAEIATLATQGNVDAQAAFALAGDKLAQALASMLKLVDVPNIVIGGGVVAAWSWLQPAFEQRLHQDLIPVLRGTIQIHLSTSGDISGMLGAALLA